MPRCAIYTRKSTEDGLEQNFNSLHAQREACEASSRASDTKAGGQCVATSTTAASLVAPWTGRR